MHERFYEIGSPEGLAELERAAWLTQTDARMTATMAARPHDIELLVPEHDVEDPELSIVIPALDEALTISDFVAWCQRGPEDAGVAGEILIVDCSTDATPQLALANGARVLRVPKRGLGRAYMDAIPYIRGRWVSWATPTAPTTSAGSRRSSSDSARATSTSWARAGRARSSPARCRACTSTSARR